MKCTCEFVEEILNDFMYCGCYKKYIGEREEQGGRCNGCEYEYDGLCTEIGRACNEISICNVMTHKVREQMEEVEKVARIYEQTQEVKREKEYKRVKDITEKVKETDMVNHPKHYANSCSIECIDAMQATFGTKDLAKYCVINAYKYLWRYKNKNGKEDLNKAEWYLNKFDELLEESDNKPYSERIPSRYVNVCITLRKWLKMANTALGGHTVNEE